MSTDRSKNAHEESFETPKSEEPPEMAAASDRPPAEESSEPLAADVPAPAESDGAQNDFDDTNAATPEVVPLDASASKVTGAEESAPYDRPPLHPVLWKMNVIEAANNAAKIQSAAHRPEIQAQLAASPEIETWPILGADGEPPKTTQELLRGTYLWESGAVEAIGDPRFTPRPADKPRNQLTKLSRGPLWTDMWFEQDTYRPVLFSGETDSWVRNRLSDDVGIAANPDRHASVGRNMLAAFVPPPASSGASPAPQSAVPTSGPEAGTPRTNSQPPSAASAKDESTAPEPSGLALALPVTPRNIEQVIDRVLRVVAPRIVSDVERIADQKVDDLEYRMWTEERRTGTD